MRLKLKLKKLKWRWVILRDGIRNNQFLLKLFNKRYFVSFIEEFWMGRDPKYEDWTEGRMEIYDNFGDSPWAIDEIRFCNNESDWWEFRERWDFKNLSPKQLALLVSVIEWRYCNPP